MTSSFKKAFLALLVLLGLCFSITKVEVVENDGFVVLGHFLDDPNDPGDVFFTIYNVEDGEFESVIYLKEGVVSGDHPEANDHVRVRRYFVSYRWKDTSNASLILIDKLPPTEHADPIPPNFTINVTVNGERVGTFDNFGDVIEDVILPEIEK